MTLTRMQATVVEVTDLSDRAREVTLALPRPLGFLSGAFVNVFIPHEGVQARRAYSISSSPMVQDSIALTIRRTLPTSPSNVFWQPDIIGRSFEIMGPLGLNTIDHVTRDRVYLVGFGIGVSVVKGMLHGLLERKEVKDIWVITGSRSEDEVLYKELFETESTKDTRVHTRFVISRPESDSYPYTGYVQEHLSDFDFTDATVYLCGQSKACEAVQADIEKRHPYGVEFLLEAFDS